MFKKLLFVFLLIPSVSFAQLTDNFENGDINSWTQTNAGHWAASTLTPINGDFSLKHVFDSTIASIDQISCVLPNIDLTSQNVCWRFRLRHSYSPSSSNNWAVFLASDTAANQMIPVGVVNGYAIGVNFTGSDDLLKLLKITNGIATVISTTTINWETQIGTSLAPAFEVVRFMDGNWEVRINKDGDFNNLSVIGSGLDLTYTTAEYFGLYYEYSASYDTRLWFDDFYFGNEIIDTIKPTLTDLSVESSKVLDLEFSERIDSASSINKLNYSVSGGIGNPDSIIFDTLSQQNVRLIFDEKFMNEQEYYMAVQNIKDVNNNIIADTSLLFTYKYIKPLSVFVIASDLLEVKFSREVDTISGKNPSNYFLNNGGGNPESVSILETDSSIVRLKFANNLTNKAYYLLNIQDVADRELDTMLNAELSFLYLVPEVNDIVINEIMADPTPEVNLPNFEYVEIYNTTPFPIDITNWKIKIGTTERIIPADTLDPDSYLILCSPTATADLGYFGETLGVNSFPTITNSGTTINLISPDSLIISKISFTTDWYNDNLKVDGGWSLERIDPLNTCSGITNWQASINENGGTPGEMNSVYSTNIDTVYSKAEKIEVVSANHLRVNFNEPLDSTSAVIVGNYEVNKGIGIPDSVLLSSNSKQVDLYFANSFTDKSYYFLTVQNITDVCGNVAPDFDLQFLYYITQPFDVVINEIMIDPFPENNLPGYEYIELYNSTEYPIDLSGWKLEIATTEVEIPSYVLDQGDYVILCSSIASTDLSLYGSVLALSSFPAILNTGSSIMISDKTGLLISSINFTTDWYNDDTKIDGGWSLERIDPLNICSGITNWQASISPHGGTPGIINSVYESNIDSIPPYVENIEIVSSTQIRLLFNEPIDSSTIVTRLNYSVNQNIGNPFSLVVREDFKQVELLFINSFPQSSNLVLTVSNIIDECDNLLISQSVDFSYYIAQPYDIVINEIMVDPDPVIYLPAFEYIEIFNKTDFNIGLSGWELITGTTRRVLPTYIFEPHSYLILCSETAYPELKDYGNALIVSGFASLSNSDQSITLKSKEKSIISSVSYSDTWYKNSLKADGGWSLEQIDPENPCGGENNWTASINSNGGTPGQQNSVMASNPDQNAPELDRITLINNRTIRLFFNETIDSISAINLSNYIVDNGIGSPDSIALISPEYSSIMLSFNLSFNDNTIYNLDILSGITDCSGNEIGNYNSARFAIPASPEFNDLVINELLFNPRTGGYDFIELYNRSQKTIDLNNLRIASYDDLSGDYISIKEIATNGYLVFPSEYVVLTENPSVVQQQYYTVNERGFVELNSLPSFNDDLGHAILLDQNETIIDNLIYDQSMHFALLATDDGVSLERMNSDRPSDDKSNWHSASELVGFATPGYKNSQFKELTDTDDKIRISPEVFSPDNDGFEDVVDIQLTFENPGYVANIKVYDSHGRLMKYIANNLLLGTENTLSWDGLNDQNQKLANGIYVIYFEIFDLKGNVKKYRKSIVVAERF